MSADGGGGKETPLLLAVYGLLRPGLSGWRRFALHRRSDYLGPCRIAGRLVDCGGYPGLIAGQGHVKADLLAIKDGGLLAELDAFEDYRPAAPQLSEYVRRCAILTGKRIGAQSYFYARRPADSMPIVAGGDWLCYARRANMMGAER